MSPSKPKGKRTNKRSGTGKPATKSATKPATRQAAPAATNPATNLAINSAIENDESKPGVAGAGGADGADTGADNTPVRLRLYVAGQTPKSLAALANLKRICSTHLNGQYLLEVIDLIKDPGLAQGDQILAIPTLVRSLPQPIRKIIGDLSDTDRVVVGLDLRNVKGGAQNKTESRR